MSPQNYLEQDFEEHIEINLLNSGYIRNISETYDKNLCLIPDEVITFLKETQPEEFKKLEQQYGSQTADKFCYRLSKEISRYGTLHILRKGIKDRGAKFKLAFFKPSSGMNPEAKKLYNQNRFTIVRQLKYSQKNENSLDIVIFLNGLPIITMELKNSLTGQFVKDAIKQYKKDRDPIEPIFNFKRCLVHFAVGNEKVFMTTKLQRAKTKFLPFNKDTENPVNPNGHKTAYLWEDILQKDTLLKLIQNYIHIQTNTEKYYDKISNTVKERDYDIFIFPRYHQLDVVRTLLKYVRKDRVGKNYLIQHSAGSGKSNEIAWLSHQLASFYQHPKDKERLFDSIIVITDRKVLDKQLQNIIKQFEQVEGVVKKIDKNSKQLRKSLEKGKDIIITTIQKFPVISEKMNSLKGRRFAVIIDEAHSGQTGEDAKHLKKTLSVNLEDAEKKDSVEFDLNEQVAKEIKTRGKQDHISYFAFTATPKNKTLELFGHKNENGKFVAHHIYSMRQAIEEGFILDVLENYTTFERYFKLIKTIEEDEEYPKSKALRLLKNYVDLQPHAIETKTRIMLEHFLNTTAKAIQGRGRAMLVTRSRLHTVKFYLMFKKIMQEMNLYIKPLVAFSGTVKDPDSEREYIKNSLNKLPPRVDIKDAFKMPEYRILIVANMFQTGFDEPFLHTMYVDKKLGGVNAVQALSRLNRTKKGKANTAVFDFVNDIKDIQDSFQDYYQTTFLEGETDPNKLYTYETELEQFEIYSKEEIEIFCKIFFNPTKPQEELQPVLDKVVNKWKKLKEDERENFRSLLQKYIRLYGFISQMISFDDFDLEKLYVFAKNLNRKLPKRDVKLPYELIEAVDLDSFRIDEIYSGGTSLIKDNGVVKPPTEGKTKIEEEETDFLSNIVQYLNDNYGLNITEEDKVDIGNIHSKLEDHPELLAVVNSNNTRENIRIKFEEVVNEIILEFVHTKLDLYKKLTEQKANSLLKKRWFNQFMKVNYRRNSLG